MKDYSFYHNKTILVTGAASGIGKLFAETIAHHADNCTLVLWDRNKEPLAALQSSLSEKATVITALLDITDVDLLRLDAEQLLKQGIIPDIILNSAGIVVGKLFHEHTMADIERTMLINTSGSMIVSHLFLEAMMERGSGTIVNMGSASAYIGNPRMSVYAASKWAIHGWSESLRLEMKSLRSKIHICTVIPSYIDTGMFEGVTSPLFVPLLTTEEIVTMMISGIARQKKEIKAPFMVHLVPFLKAFLPAALFDWLAGSVLGVYRSMDSFQGKRG